MGNNKFVIYQVLPRLFGNDSVECVPGGDIRTNGVGKFADFNALTLRKIKDKGVTHIWYTGIIEHASKTEYPGLPATHPAIVKGNAGSPYAIRDYYDVSADLALNVEDRMREFEDLVARTHRNGLKVIIDFVPNHVSRQYVSDAKPAGVEDLGANDDQTKAFSPYNNFYYIPGTKLAGNFDMIAGAAHPYEELPAKVTGNDCFNQYPSVNDWFETVKLNYGIDYMNGRTRAFSPIPDTWFKMLDILRFWAGKGVDGFRCDMAEMVPVEFWNWAISRIKDEFKDVIFIAEVYNPSLYNSYIKVGGFDYLYDKVGLYDTMRDVVSHGRAASDISYCWQSLGDIQEHMLNFLENHDEQRVASDFFAKDPFRAVPALAVSALMNVNPFMIYFGQEFGERGMDTEGYSGRDGRTTIFDYWSVDTVRRWRNGGNYDGRALTARETELSWIYSAVMHIALNERAVTKGRFFDVTYANFDNPAYDTNRLYSFVRGIDNEYIFVLANFADHPADAEVVFPQHLFDYFGLRETIAGAVDLMSGEKKYVHISSRNKLRLHVDAFGVRILKIEL